MNNPTRSIIPFTYSVSIDTLSLGAGADTIVFDLAADFELHYLMGSSSQDVASDFHPNNFTLQLQDNTTNRDFFSGPLPQNICCGPSNLNPFQHRPVTFPANTRLRISVQNLVAQANTITIALVGYKIFN